MPVDTKPPKKLKTAWASGFVEEQMNAASGFTTPLASKSTSKESASEPDLEKTWWDHLIGSIMIVNADSIRPRNAVLLGQVSAVNQEKRCLSHAHFAADHWSNGKATIPVGTDVIQAVDIFFVTVTQEEINTTNSLHAAQSSFSIETMRRPPPAAPMLSRVILSHNSPRFVSITVAALLDQLIGDESMDHELCALAFRRLTQIDGEILYPSNTPRWRHFFEPDFSTHVLAGENVWEMASIQAQFTGNHIFYNLMDCTMFFMPTIFEFGWCLYAWDMQRKVIHILDPFGCNSSRGKSKSFHETVADKIHIALFTCIYKYFTSWHVDCLRWTKEFHNIPLINANGADSGPCVVHAAKHFNGLGFKHNLVKESLAEEKKTIIADLVELEGNSSQLPDGLRDLMFV